MDIFYEHILKTVIQFLVEFSIFTKRKQREGLVVNKILCRGHDTNMGTNTNGRL